MVDFRKWLLALAAVGLLLGIGSSTANAQNSTTFTCQASSGVPNLLRAEGVTELVGDLILNCTGGTPTAPGAAIALQNIQISINTNITSRIESTGNLSEALLLIDTPYPATGAFPPPPVSQAPTQNDALTQLACQAVNSTNCAITSINPGVGIGAIGAAGNYNGSPGHYNIFQGFQNGVNAIAWDGVPVDAPGTAGTRVIRITNVRANASQLGVSSTLIPTQVSMIVSVSGSTFISVLQPSNGNVVGNVTPGLLSSAKTAAYVQCNSVNTYLLAGTITTDAGIAVTATEGFAASFKTQNYTQLYDVAENGVGGPLGPGDTAYLAPGSPSLQNIPGFNYNAESGFYPGPVTGLGQSTTEPIGLADHGTQIQFTIGGVGAGVSLFAPSYVYLTGNYSTSVQTTLGVAVLVGQSASGTGAISSPSTGVPVAYSTGGTPLNGAPVPVNISGTSASLVYEIYYADPSVIESLTVPISIAYITTGPTVPAPTTTPSTVTVNFSPLSVTPTASATDPIPRFVQPYPAANFYTIAPCSCNLLFPFVANTGGFDTGVAIANTSEDTLNNVTNQSGTVTLTYYGSGAPPSQTTNAVVPAGSEVIFTLSSGGNYGIAATPGFEGYIVSRANFQYCHGFAFLSPPGAQGQGASAGYLAIQLDLPTLNRTGVPGENEGH
jgi:hypothetical protein